MAASTSLTSAQRTLRARMAANTRWSQPDARTHQADARLERYAREVDPDGRLDDKTRIALAKQRRRAHMQSLALASSKARSRQAAAADAT